MFVPGVATLNYNALNYLIFFNETSMPLTYFDSKTSKCAFNKSLPICFIYSTDSIIYKCIFLLPRPLDFRVKIESCRKSHDMCQLSLVLNHSVYILSHNIKLNDSRLNHVLQVQLF